MPIENFGVCVLPDKKSALYREMIGGESGDLYRGGQPDERGFADLIQMGVKTIIKLSNDSEYPDWKESELSLGTARLLPLAEIFRFDDEAAVLAIVERIQAGLSRGNVFVHCRRGTDRTGMVVAAWRLLYCGYTLEAALKERAEFGTNSILDLTVDEPDVAFLKKLDAKTNGKPTA